MIKHRNLSTVQSFGFTLIELLVVVSIIGMLSSVVMVSLQSARMKGRVGAGVKFATYNYRAFGADALLVWNFNEPNGAALDMSGNNLTGTLTAAVTRATNDTPVGSGSSLLFDGIGGVESVLNSTIPSSLAAATLGNHTVSLWVKPASIVYPQQVLVGRRVVNNNNTRALMVLLNVDSLNPGRHMVGGDYTCYIPFDHNLVLNNWYHITYTRNTSGTINIYVDGKIVGSGSCPSAPGTLAEVMINQSSNFTGNVDDVAIYTRTLLASEVEAIYAEGAAKRGLAVAE